MNILGFRVRVRLAPPAPRNDSVGSSIRDRKDSVPLNSCTTASNRGLRGPPLHFVYQEVRRLTLAALVASGCRGVGVRGSVMTIFRTGNHRTGARKQAGLTVNESCKCLVQDAFPGRFDRKAPELT